MGRKQQLPEASCEHFSPDKAREELALAGRNRKLAATTVNRYADIMLRDAWHLNGEPIIFDRDGKLIDGQHRLAAVVQSGKTVAFMVVRGVDPESIMTIDTGVSKTPTHYLAMTGEENPRLLASTLKYVMRWHAGWPTRMARIDNDVMQLALSLDGGVRGSVAEAAQYAQGFPFRGKLPLPAFAWLHYAACLTHSIVDADEFMDGVMRGISLKASDPCFALRERIINRESGGGGKAGWDRMLSLSISAWNLWCQDKTVVRLQSPRRGSGIPAMIGEDGLRKDTDKMTEKRALIQKLMESPERQARIARQSPGAGVGARTQTAIKYLRDFGNAGLTTLDLMDLMDLSNARVHSVMQPLREKGLVASQLESNGKPGQSVLRFRLLES